MSEISQRPALAPHVRRHVDRATGGAMLLHPEGAIELDGAADAIVQLCDGARTLDAIVAALAEEYEAPEGAIRNDVTDCLRALAAAGVVKWA